MINPIKMLKDYKQTKVSSKELELSGEFIQWALNNNYDLFKLAFDKVQMDKCLTEYKNYMEGVNYENKSF